MGSGKQRAKVAPKTRRSPLKPTDASLFDPLTEGEEADALRLLLEDPRVANMANIGRYRIIASEPWVTKPKSLFANKRLVRLVVYDYASSQCVEAGIDLGAMAVTFLTTNSSQPMLAPDEEREAIQIALADERVTSALGDNDSAQSATHYWSHRESDLAYNRRSAAVIFGETLSSPSLVAVIDLNSNSVHDVVAASKW